MSPKELVTLARRHVIAVTLVLLVAAGTAFTFKHTPPTYTESATLILTLPQPNTYGSSFQGSLVTTGEVAVNWMMGPQGQERAHRAGATDDFSVALVNFSNQEYPYYVVPYITVSASAQDPATAHQQFTIVTRILSDYLAVRQRQEGVPLYSRIRPSMVGDTGPLLQQGSRIRTFAGLLVLTMVAMYLVAAFLDRHPIRPRALSRSRRHDIHDRSQRSTFARSARLARFESGR